MSRALIYGVIGLALTGCLGNGVHHHSLEGSLTDATHEQSLQEVLLGQGAAAEQGGEEPDRPLAGLLLGQEIARTEKRREPLAPDRSKRQSDRQL